MASVRMKGGRPLVVSLGKKLTKAGFQAGLVKAEMSLHLGLCKLHGFRP